MKLRENSKGREAGPELPAQNKPTADGKDSTSLRESVWMWLSGYNDSIEIKQRLNPGFLG